ncbi:DNA repair protein RecN [Pygmaiobacter massiliensis]|uniref:DNA repair protein RecN n=1 Tax=Pygmaiobacter massiliensis TaxID=1917873 RepID=UPI002897E519|nr:DNA repair protein RecN [Pygmaiobacter massiliensis]
MLNELTIENVAVIEKVCVRFDQGLNALTGETGAGKSILIDSINAILGNRTSRDLVRNGAEKAAIWASFTDLPQSVQKKLADTGYAQEEDELLLYREIHTDGKTSCRINGRPATATLLRELSADLINIHGQHDNQVLLCPEKHLAVLDAYAQNENLRTDYYASYVVLRDIVRQIKALSMDEEEKQRRMELLRYEVDEIDAAALTDGEEETLMEQRNRIRNAQKILDALGIAYGALQGEETRGGIDILGDAVQSIEEITPLSAEYKALSEKLNEVYYAAQDAAENIKSLLDEFDFDAADLDATEERLDLIYKLKRKYGDSISAILAYGEKAREELDTISFSEEKLEKLSAQRKIAFAEAKEKAEALTRNRKEAFLRFTEQITESLRFLNMPGIVLELAYQESKIGPTGHDVVEFLISTNPGEKPKPLAKIASGGELSRIMLAIKSAMADNDHIGTIIYDEIDTGVSGLAAGRIGKKLKETAGGHQVICVTHTAQIAAQADHHLLIQKSVSGDRTFTEIYSLSPDARISELARIISGDQITELALANAKEMLEMAEA